MAVVYERVGNIRGCSEGTVGCVVWGYSKGVFVVVCVCVGGGLPLVLAAIPIETS